MLPAFGSADHVGIGTDFEVELAINAHPLIKLDGGYGLIIPMLEKKDTLE